MDSPVTRRSLRSVAASVPGSHTPFSLLLAGTVTRDGIGVLYCHATPILAGGTLVIAHGLGRVPNRCSVLDNLAAYKGDSFFTSRDTQNCTIQFQNAISVGAVTKIE